MITFIIRRLLIGVITILFVSLLIFLAMRLLPGDPLSLYISQNSMGDLTSEQLAEMRHKFGLDKSMAVQYVNWVGGIARLDFGVSIFYNESVGLLIAERAPVTLHLGLMAFVVSAIFGISFGVICALRRGRWIDTVVTLIANVGITMPTFWVGILLIYVLALKAGLLPVLGYTSPFADFWQSARQAIMPVFCLSLFPLASLCRQARSAMLEVIQQDYIRTAWAKGLRERIIVTRHAIKNAMIPVITVMGLHVAVIIGGSVIVETVFNIPGLGRLMTQSLLQKDFQVVQAGVLMIAAAVVLANLVVDISYGWLDPRIRYD